MSGDEFIAIVAPVLIDHWIEYRITPSVIIAEAAIISNWGLNDVALRANNLFQLQPSATWTGKVYDKTITTTTRMGKPIPYTKYYRKYDSWKDSIVDYIESVLSKPIMDSVRDTTNQGDTIDQILNIFTSEGMSTHNIRQQMVTIIKDYKLMMYDRVLFNKNPYNLATIGDQGDIVKWIQYELGVRGIYEVLQDDTTHICDGLFDYSLMSAVKEFQKKVGLEPTGVFDLKTMKMMISTEA